MSFITYDEKLALPPFGLRNSGAICYFNSMLQCFIGCTSVINTFESDPDLQKRNDLCVAVWSMITAAREGKPTSQFSVIIWTAFMRMLKELKMEYNPDKIVGTGLGTGMECANEGFVKFIEAFDAPEILELFQHRYVTIMHCTECGNTRETQNDKGEINYDENVFFEFGAEQFKQNGELQDMIVKRVTAQEIDGYKCGKCGLKSKHLRTERLTFTPEVLIVLFVKYSCRNGRVRYERWAADIPESITIAGKRADIHYRMTGLNEHSGDTEGGHYWAHTLRKDANGVSMWRLNDMSAAHAPDAACSASTYMAWYHAV